MKFYIASSFANLEKVREAAGLLKEQGFEQTYDWTQNSRASSIEDLKRIGQLEREAVLKADFLVVLLPAGKGSHIELGIAAGQGKPVYLLSESEAYFEFDVTSTFYYLPEVKILIGSAMDNIRELIGIENKNKSVQ